MYRLTHCGPGKCVNQNGLSAPNCYHYPRNKFDSQRRRFFKLMAESFLLETTIIACVFLKSAFSYNVNFRIYTFDQNTFKGIQSIR